MSGRSVDVSGRGVRVNGRSVGVGSAIPDIGDHQWYMDDETTLDDYVGSISATVTGATRVSDSKSAGGYHLDFDGTDDNFVTDSTVGDMTVGSLFGWVNFDDMTDFDNFVISCGGDGNPDNNPQGGINLHSDGPSEVGLIQYDDIGGGAQDLENVSFVSTGNWGFFVVTWNVDSESEARLITYSESQNLADVTNSSIRRTWSGDKYVYGGEDRGVGLDGQIGFAGCAVGTRLTRTQADDLWEATR